MRDCDGAVFTARAKSGKWLALLNGRETVEIASRSKAKKRRRSLENARLRAEQAAKRAAEPPVRPETDVRSTADDGLLAMSWHLGEPVRCPYCAHTAHVYRVNQDTCRCYYCDSLFKLLRLAPFAIRVPDGLYCPHCHGRFLGLDDPGREVKCSEVFYCGKKFVIPPRPESLDFRS